MNATAEKIDVAELEASLESAREEISTLEDELDQAKEKVLSDDVEDAVNAVLDEVQRPVGSFACVLPNTPASQRALMRLFDAVGRNP